MNDTLVRCEGYKVTLNGGTSGGVLSTPLSFRITLSLDGYLIQPEDHPTLPTLSTPLLYSIIPAVKVLSIYPLQGSIQGGTILTITVEKDPLSINGYQYPSINNSHSYCQFGEVISPLLPVPYSPYTYACTTPPFDIINGPLNSWVTLTVSFNEIKAVFVTNKVLSANLSSSLTFDQVNESNDNNNSNNNINSSNTNNTSNNIRFLSNLNFTLLPIPIVTACFPAAFSATGTQSQTETLILTVTNFNEQFINTNTDTHTDVYIATNMATNIDNIRCYFTSNPTINHTPLPHNLSRYSQQWSSPATFHFATPNASSRVECPIPSATPGPALLSVGMNGAINMLGAYPFLFLSPYTMVVAVVPDFAVITGKS